MPDTGIDLGADLYLLWRAGRDNLPSVAAVFATANRAVAETDDGLDNAFRRSDHFGGGAQGPVFPQWTALRDELQLILANTAVNLEATGDALCLAATEYAKTDEAAAREFERLRIDSGDPPRTDVPHPQYP